MLLPLMTMEAPPSGGGAEYLEKCISGIARGDSEALARLYEATRAAINGFALFLLKDPHDAEDATQDTFVQVWLCAGQYEARGKPMAWLMTIARNQALMRLRDRRRTVTLAPEDWQEQFADKPAVSREDILTLQALLETLTDEERQIVTLHALAGLKHRETAEILDLALPTVLSKYHRAIKKLARSLEETER